MARAKTCSDIQKRIVNSVEELDIQMSYDPQLKLDIHNTLRQRNGNNHLWVTLAVQQLWGLKNNNEALMCLQRIPMELYDFYDQILRRTPQQYAYETRFLFHLMTVLRRGFINRRVCLRSMPASPARCNFSNLSDPRFAVADTNSAMGCQRRFLKGTYRSCICRRRTALTPFFPPLCERLPN